MRRAPSTPEASDDPLAGESRRVADVLLQRIVAGAYPAGLRLPAEVDLAEQLGCGRSTVREALRHLAGLGVVRSRRGSGAHVLDFRREGTPALLPSWLAAGARGSRPEDVAVELLRLRGWLAREAVRLAATYATSADLREAQALLDAAPGLEARPFEHALNELAFFRALVFASRMWPAAWLANAFWGPLRELYGLIAPAIARVPADFQPTMTRLLALVRERRTAEADKVMTRWLERVDAQLLEDVGALLGDLSRQEVRT